MDIDHFDDEDPYCCCCDCEDEDPYGYGELEDLRAIPPLHRPEDMRPVRSQADLHRHWRSLMGELGFGCSRVFMQVLGGDGRCTPAIFDVTDIPDVPDPATADGLLGFCATVLSVLNEPDARVALLYARPGGVTERESDLRWALLLTEAAAARDVPIFPVHLANDEELTVVTPDDLATQRSRISQSGHVRPSPLPESPGGDGESR